MHYLVFFLISFSEAHSDYPIAQAFPLVMRLAAIERYEGRGGHQSTAQHDGKPPSHGPDNAQKVGLFNAKRQNSCAGGDYCGKTHAEDVLELLCRWEGHTSELKSHSF